MTVRENPGEGYLVEAAKFVENEPLLEKYAQLLEDADYENALEALNEWLKERHLPEAEEIFSFGDDDTPGEFGRGIPYVRFDESVLFERKPTFQHTGLIGRGLAPQHGCWSMWG
jgi:hypothetical protein